MGRKEVKLREFPTSERATHIKLVKGVYTINPHVRVLCPKLVETGSCRKRKRKRGRVPITRPEFLLRNYNDSKLELWQCSGCKDFLLRVEL